MKILIADDHAIVRAGILTTLRENELFTEFLECETGDEALRITDEQNPDYVFMDLSLPKKHGLVVIRELRQKGFDGKIVVLTFHQEEEYIYKSYQAGANGYVRKVAAVSNLNHIVARIEKGARFAVEGYDEEALERLLQSYQGKVTVSREFYGDVFLTAREREVLKGVLAGKTTAELAEDLGISIKTVNIYRGNLLAKYKSKNMAELAGKVMKG